MGIQQQESTLIVGTITQSGDATFTITKAGMTGSALAVSVAVLITDTPTITAGKAAAGLNLNANFAAACLAYNIGATLYVMAIVAAANDATMNIAYTNGTCTGLTPDATSDHAVYGEAGGIVNGYATLAEIHASKRITSVSAIDDGFLEDLINTVSRYWDGITGKRFYTTSADETRYFTTIDGVCYPGYLISVTTLKTDNDADRVYENTWATTDFDLLPDNAALDGKPYTSIERAPNGVYSFPSHRRGVQIAGKFGYSATRPDPVNTATIITVTSLYLSRFGANVEGVATITGAGVVITPKDIPASAMELMKQYIDTGMGPG